jgi:hypothetical protein
VALAYQAWLADELVDAARSGRLIAAGMINLRVRVPVLNVADWFTIAFDHEWVDRGIDDVLGNPRETLHRIWWVAAALVAGQATYWLMTHPVNKEKDVATTGLGAAFFSAFGGQQTGDWRELRNSWELSHAIIFGFIALSLIALAYATSLHEQDG